MHLLSVMQSAGKANTMSNIVDVVVADKKLTTLCRSVKTAGLDTVLSQQGPFTVFAPTDVAFGKLVGGRLEHLQRAENKSKLTELLNHHVVAGIINYKDLTDNQTLTTMSGKELTVKIVKDKVIINGAIVQAHDTEGTNGVVHLLDAVIDIR